MLFYTSYNIFPYNLNTAWMAAPKRGPGSCDAKAAPQTGSCGVRRPRMRNAETKKRSQINTGRVDSQLKGLASGEAYCTCVMRARPSSPEKTIRP